MEPLTRVHPLGCDFSLDVPLRTATWYAERGYEPFSAAIFRQSSRGCDVVIDIGAHVGYYTLLASTAHPGARVIAIEASPEKAAVLAHNVATAGVETATVLNAAFGDESDLVRFQLAEASDHGGVTGYLDSPTLAEIHTLAEIPTLAEIKVSGITGRDLAVEPGQRVLVRVDVEGHEITALEGLRPVLEEATEARLLVGFDPKFLRAAGRHPDDLLTWLFDHHFRAFALDERGATWRELTSATSPLATEGPSSQDLYCLPTATALTVTTVMHSSELTAGVERIQQDVVEDLVAGGCMVHTVMPGPDRGLGTSLRTLGSAVSLIDPYPWWMTFPESPDLRLDDGPVPDLVHLPLVEALAECATDVVLTQTAVIPQGAVAAAMLGRPHVWWLQEFGDLDHGLRLPLPPDRLGALMHELSSLVITNSAAVRDHYFPGDATAAEVVYPAPPMDPMAARLPRSPRPLTVGVIGSLNEGKGQADAIGAIAMLRAEDVDIELVCIGSGSPTQTDRLRNLITALGLGPHVRLAGPFDERQDIYSMVDVVAVTSRSEAFGRVPFEATAFGLPVVYATSGGVVEYMTSGGTGLGYPPGDVRALADRLKELVSDPHLGPTLVAGARRELAVFRETARSGLQTVLRHAAHDTTFNPTRALAHWMAKHSSVAGERLDGNAPM